MPTSWHEPGGAGRLPVRNDPDSLVPLCVVNVDQFSLSRRVLLAREFPEADFEAVAAPPGLSS